MLCVAVLENFRKETKAEVVITIYQPETEFTKKQNPEASLWIFKDFLTTRASL
jgi:hypothetical protein